MITYKGGLRTGLHPDKVIIMESVRKLARSQSVKVSEMLNLPPKVERSISDSKVEEQEMTEDSDTPSILPILRVTGHTGTKEQRKEKEKKEKCNGKLFIKYCSKGLKMTTLFLL